MTFKSILARSFRYGTLALALVATAGVSAVLSMRAILASQDVIVPRLLGHRMGEASGRAAQNSLLLKLEGRRYDPAIPLDQVAAQDPLPGAVIKTNRTVRVWLSMGPQRLNVPAVEGESVRGARLKLEQAGLPVAHVVDVDDAAPEGTVLVQRPPAGEVDEISGVSLLVSRGVMGIDYVMPDLIGRSAADAIAGLNRAGLRVADLRYRTYPGLEAGVILRQSPAAGYRISRRSTVSLDVSRPS